MVGALESTDDIRLAGSHLQVPVPEEREEVAGAQQDVRGLTKLRSRKQVRARKGMNRSVTSGVPRNMGPR